MRSNEPKKNRTHRYVKVVLGLALLFAVGALASGALGQATEGTGTGTDTTATDTTAPSTTDTTTSTDTSTTTTTDAVPSDPPPAAPASSPLTPTISSDQADYPPGGAVTLTGAGWGPGESVHLFVNDSAGQTWSYNADVTADAFGALTNTFNLPNWFVANYSVTATGSSGSVAQSAFTDSKVSTVSVANPISVTVAAGDTAVYGTVTVALNGNQASCAVTLGVDTALPAGVTAVFGNGSFTSPAPNPPVDSSFSLSTTASTPVGTTIFHVTATDGAGCQYDELHTDADADRDRSSCSSDEHSARPDQRHQPERVRRIPHIHRHGKRYWRRSQRRRHGHIQRRRKHALFRGRAKRWKHRDLHDLDLERRRESAQHYGGV